MTFAEEDEEEAPPSGSVPKAPLRNPRKQQGHSVRALLSRQVSWISSSEGGSSGRSSSGTSSDGGGRSPGESGGGSFSRQSSVRQSATSHQRSGFSTSGTSRKPPPLRRPKSAMADTEKEEAVNLVSAERNNGHVCCFIFKEYWIVVMQLGSVNIGGVDVAALFYYCFGLTTQSRYRCIVILITHSVIREWMICPVHVLFIWGF